MILVLLQRVLIPGMCWLWRSHRDLLCAQFCQSSMSGRSWFYRRLKSAIGSDQKVNLTE